MHRCFAMRHISYSKIGIVLNLAVPTSVLLRNQQAGKDAGFTQQPLEAVIGHCLPAVEAIPHIRINT